MHIVEAVKEIVRTNGADVLVTTPYGKVERAVDVLIGEAAELGAGRVDPNEYVVRIDGIYYRTDAGTLGGVAYGIRA